MSPLLLLGIMDGNEGAREHDVLEHLNCPFPFPYMSLPRRLKETKNRCMRDVFLHRKNTQNHQNSHIHVAFEKN